MSQSVTRLKELLFDGEAQEIAALSRRLEQVALNDTRAREELRGEIKHEISGVMERAGTEERFTASVSEVLNEALQRAEIAQHSDLSNTIAPLVVTTIKTELRNSQDEMVEALYPITGRLVKSYVASAIKDLTEQMNRRLEQNALMLRLQSLVTGRSVAELALAGTQDFEVQELFLIGRGSGALVAHWPQGTGTRQQEIMSGVLAAINAFATEAFAAEETSMRQIDLGEATVYLRGSPLYLLAARCTGTAPKGAEQVLDDAFLAAVEKENGADSLKPADAEQWHRRVIGELGDELKARIADQKSEIAGPPRSPLKILASLILIPLIGALAWVWTSNFMNARARETAEAAIASTSEMQGYPAEIEASNFGRSLKVSGLAPSQSIKDHLLNRLTLVLPKTAIQEELNVVPGSDIKIPDLAPAIDSVRQSVKDLETGLQLAGIRRTVERAERRLAQAEADVRWAAKLNRDTAKAAALDKSAAAVGIISKELMSARAGLPASATGPEGGSALQKTAVVLDGLAVRTGAQSEALLALIGRGQPPARRDGQPAADPIPTPIVETDNLASETDRLAGVAASLALASTIPPPSPPPPEPSLRSKLRDWTVNHAIFFADGTDYRNASTASETLDSLIPLLRNAKTLVRVAGYTDDTGTGVRNGVLGHERAEKVRQDLIARGAPAEFLTAVGRSDAKDLSTAQGYGSLNRRVEFELGFEGEGAP